MRSLRQYLEKVISHVEATGDRYVALCRSGLTTYPIPFFGDVESAVVLTVGVNPSAREFLDRGWPDEMSSSALKSRLQRYFTGSVRPPHHWFATWSEALQPLGVSYLDGAAHVDLSPRATASMRSVPNELFAEMVEADVALFFELLSHGREARCLLLAGCVTKRWYLNKFLEHVAPRFGFRFDGAAETTGEGRVGIHRLQGPGVDLPAFFSSVSPSARNKRLLIERVGANQGIIAAWLGRESGAAADPLHPACR